MSELVKTEYPKYFFISNIAAIQRNIQLISESLSIVVVGSAGGSKQGVVMVNDPEIIARRDSARSFVKFDREKPDPESSSEERSRQWAIFESWNTSDEISKAEYERLVAKADPSLGASSHKLAPTSITGLRDLGKEAAKQAQSERIRAEADATQKVVESVDTSAKKAERGMGLLSVGKTPGK